MISHDMEIHVLFRLVRVTVKVIISESSYEQKISHLISPSGQWIRKIKRNTIVKKL